MRVCGVDIKASEANLVVCEPSAGAAIPLKLATKRLKLAEPGGGAELKSLLRAIEAFLHENNVDALAIKQRQSRGTMSASGVTFKIEALFELAQPSVYMVHGKTLEKFSKCNVAGVPADLPKFQTDAFLSAAWRLNEANLL